MTIFKNSDQWDKSNVIFEQDQITKYDKKDTTPQMKFIDYGLGIIQKKCFNNVKINEVIDLADIYKSLAENKKLLGFEVKERFYIRRSTSSNTKTSLVLHNNRVT